MASRGRAKWKPQSGFGSDFGAEVQSATIPYALIKNARHSGQLNLSNRNLTEVPTQVWRINIDVPEEGKDASIDTGDGDRWWEQVDLKKLILASNQIKELSAEVKNLPALNVLDAHDNQLESLPDELGELQEIGRLNLSHNKFSSLPASVTQLQMLKVLLLNGNILNKIPEEFGQLQNVDELDLADNKLTALPESFGNLVKLRKLNLSNNQLEMLPQSMGGLTALTYLNLRSNKLKSLPKGLDSMKCLDMLDCRANLISEFPPIEGEVNLKELCLSNNRIKELDSKLFQHLPMLMILDVKDNTIQNIPEEITTLRKLERLDLTNNHISVLPNVIGNMENIKSISLDGNPLRGLRRDIVAKGTGAVLNYLKSRIVAPLEQQPGSLATREKPREINDNFMPSGNEVDSHKISTTKKIEYCNKKATSIPEGYFLNDVAITGIDFSKNQLTEVPLRITSYSSSLKELNLSANKLTSIPVELAGLERLTYLNLGNNAIKDLPVECCSWKCLLQIIITANRFTVIPKFLYDLSTLETILAGSNQITEIDVDGLKKLPNIGALDLCNNNIGNVPPELGNVTTLKQLQLEGNPFRNPRRNILIKGTGFLLEYLRDRIPR